MALVVERRAPTIWRIPTLGLEVCKSDVIWDASSSRVRVGTGLRVGAEPLKVSDGIFAWRLWKRTS